MKLRRHFVIAALAFVLLLAGTVFHTQVLGFGREILDTDDYAEGKEHFPRVGLKSETTNT